VNKKPSIKMKPLPIQYWLVASLLLWLAAGLALSSFWSAHHPPRRPAAANSHLHPTQADRRIIYIVKTNDTLLGISLVTIVAVENCAP
jgi:hypothetical protein